MVWKYYRMLEFLLLVVHSFSSDFVYIFLWYKSAPNCTVLQKLSKCEVKALLCWNLMILPPLRFCMKSQISIFKWSKNVISGNFRDAELWILVNLGLESWSDLLKIKIQHLWNCYKWRFWTGWIRQNVISRKIGVAVKSSNFNKVKP